LVGEVIEETRAGGGDRRMKRGLKFICDSRKKDQEHRRMLGVLKKKKQIGDNKIGT